MIKPVFHLIFQVPAIILLLQLWSVDSSSSSSVNPIGLLNNRFGSCKIENAGRIHGQYLEPEESPNTWYYSNILPSQTEKEEYDKVNPSFSKTNKAYVLGLVNGTSQLKKFLRPRQTWQFPPDHPRQNKSLCYSMLQAALQPSILHEPYRESQKSNGLMYLLRASNVLIRGSGIFASSCGYYQPIEACETIMKRIGRIWWNKCSRQLKKKEITYQQLYQQLSSNSSTNQLSLQDSKRMCIFRTMTKDWQYVDQVFVLTAGWDSNYGHFIIDSLPRIIRFLPFLQDNPNIKIHIRFHEQFVNITMPDYHQKFTKSFRNGFFRVLNISSDRLIYGPIVARELYYPRPMTCASALIHPYELRLLSKTLKESVTSRLSKRMNHTTLNATSNRGVFLPFRIQKDVHQTQATSVLRIVIQVRYCANKTICYNSERAWNDTDIVHLVASFSEQFPTAKILTIKDDDALATKCLECEIYEYSKADILVGLHGAGIPNLIFMKPGSIVMEITGYFDPRGMPVCGFNAPLSAVFGIHYYGFYYDLGGKVQLPYHELASEVKLFRDHTLRHSI